MPSSCFVQLFRPVICVVKHSETHTFCWLCVPQHVHWVPGMKNCTGSRVSILLHCARTRPCVLCAFAIPELPRVSIHNRMYTNQSSISYRLVTWSVPGPVCLYCPFCEPSGNFVYTQFWQLITTLWFVLRHHQTLEAWVFVHCPRHHTWPYRLLLLVSPFDSLRFYGICTLIFVCIVILSLFHQLQFISSSLRLRSKTFYLASCFNQICSIRPGRKKNNFKIWSIRTTVQASFRTHPTILWGTFTSENFYFNYYGLSPTTTRVMLLDIWPVPATPKRRRIISAGSSKVQQHI